ncbi:MAG: hypothetical protein ACRC46_05880 [Thermoguttaceae bacterium]
MKSLPINPRVKQLVASDDCRMRRNAVAVLVSLCLIVACCAVATATEDGDKYLYVRDIETTLRGEKAAAFCEPLDEIVHCMNDRTGKVWWRSNCSFSALGGYVTKPIPRQIGMFPAKVAKTSVAFGLIKKTEKRDPNWYKITITDGVLIQGNERDALMNAADHLIDLLEGAGNELRFPRGVFTPQDRATRFNATLHELQKRERRPQ